MKTKTFKYEQGIVHVHYEKLPTKEDLEEACKVFMSKVMIQKEKDTAATVSND